MEEEEEDEEEPLDIDIAGEIDLNFDDDEPKTDESKEQMGCVTQKGGLCPESLSYQKKGGRAGPRPPFFLY